METAASVVPTKAGPARVQENSASAENAPSRIRGTTMRWTWTEGPTSGTTHEHVFNEDGTMTWRVLDGPKSGKAGFEKKYGEEMIASDVGVVSYLAESGYTITMVLNFGNGRMVGFASNAKEWMAVKGSFEVAD